MAERKLTVILAGDAKGLVSAVDTADRKVSGFGGKLGGLSGKAKAAFAGAGIAAIGFGKSSIDAFVEAEEAQKALGDAFERFPNLAGTSQAALQKLNSELQRKTKFDDDAIASGQAVVAQFGVTGKQLESLTPLIVDYASRTGKDIPAAAQDVGKAMLGNAKALKNIGIKYTATGDKAKDFANIQELLRQQVGGFAEKEGTTAAGKAAILANQFGELQETVGSKLVPALLKAADFLTTRVLPVLGRMGSWLVEHKPVLIAIAGVIGVAIVAAFVSWAAAAASAAAATIAATWPILAIIGVIAALVAGVIYAYQHWDVFRNVVDAVAGFVKNTLWPVLQSVAGWITGTLIPTIGRVASKIGEWIGVAAGVVSDVKGFLGDLVSFVTGLPGKIGRAASGMFDGIKNAFRSAINWVIRGWNALEFKIPGFDPPGPGPKFGGFTLGLPNIAQLATGGIVTGPTLAMIGEGRHDEAVIPLDGRRLGGNTYNITVRADATTDKGELGRAIVESISAYERRNGSTWRAS